MQSARVVTSIRRFNFSYGFFVAMGGITVSTAAIHEHISKITLTRQGVASLATHGHFVEISDEEIVDRSKANPIAKALVCSLVLWFFSQCIVRFARGYPLALLEIHTMVHVVCAILTYILWWKVLHFKHCLN